MTNVTVSILFVVGVVIGFLLGLLLARVKKAGTIEFTQYDDGGRTACQIVFDMSPDELAPLKKMLFEAKWHKGTSQK